MASGYALILSSFYLGSGVFVFLLGLTILRVGGNSPATRATALMLFFCGIGPLLSATSIILLRSLKEGDILYTSMAENFEYLWKLYFPSLLLFSLTFPRENRYMKKFPLLGFLIFVPYIFHLAMMMLTEGSLDLFSHLRKAIFQRAALPVGSSNLPLSGVGRFFSVILSLLLRVHKLLFSLVDIGYAVLAVTFLAKNTGRILSPRISRQLRTVLIGLTASIAGYALARLVPLAWGGPISGEAGLVLINFSLLVGGGAIAYAVIRQRFLGIKFIVRKSVLYGGLALVFALLYLIVVKPVSSFFGNYSVLGNGAFETAFVILTIIAFQPALVRVEELLGGLLLKGREDRGAKLRVLGGELLGVAGLGDLERVLERAFSDMLDATRVRLFFSTGDFDLGEFTDLLGEVGEPITRQELMKLREKVGPTRRGDQKGLWHWVRKSPARPFSPAWRIPDFANDFEVFVPVVKDRSCIGFLSLSEKSYSGKYSSEDLSMLSIVSNQVSVALERIRLLEESVEQKMIEEELKIARRIQGRLLPSAPPVIPGYDLHALTVPCRYVGGDYYDFILLDEETLAVAIADVSGKGIPASLLMATLQAAIRSSEEALRSPKAMIGRLNKLLFGSTSPEEFATLFYSVIDLATGRLTYANAGHDYPFLLEEGGTKRLEEGGIVLGCIDEYPYEEKTCSVTRGAALVLYTDGLTEAVTGGDRLLGEKRLERVLSDNVGKSAREMCEMVLREMGEVPGDREDQDDVTMVVLKRKSPSD